jgi:cell division septation protein DedD
LLLIMIISTGYAQRRQAGKWLDWLGTKVSGKVNTVAAAATINPRSASVDTNSNREVKPEIEFNLRPPQFPPPALEVPNGNLSVPPPLKVQPAAAKTRKPAAAGKQLVVQVAALAQEADARKMVEGLRQENFKAFVQASQVDSLYRVTLGPYSDAVSARSSIAKLKKAGFNAFIRREVIIESAGT